MTVPHASWAGIYDLVYEESFGQFYDALTNTTIDQIKKTVQPPASIVDFGAGTGAPFNTTRRTWLSWLRL